jgi:rhomboid family GlyGly-CTERM serine protease
VPEGLLPFVMLATVTMLMQRARRLPGASLLLSFFTLALWFVPSWTSGTEWTRSDPNQLWRWFTAHFTHWSVSHLTWDLVVFLGLGILCERRSRKGFLQCIAFAAFAITVAVATCCPNISVYRGLSGLDSALFGWLLADLASHALARRRSKTVLLIAIMAGLFVAKTAIECFTQSTIFVSAASTFVPVPLAHVVGFVAGAITAWFGTWNFRLTSGSRAWFDRSTTSSHEPASQEVFIATRVGRGRAGP